MTKILRGLRGATTARANTSEAILQATAELLRALLEANDFQPEDVESAIFTSSPDLTAEYPARAARLLGCRALAGRSSVDLPHRHLRRAARRGRDRERRRPARPPPRPGAVFSQVGDPAAAADTRR